MLIKSSRSYPLELSVLPLETGVGERGGCPGWERRVDLNRVSGTWVNWRTSLVVFLSLWTCVNSALNQARPPACWETLTPLFPRAVVHKCQFTSESDLLEKRWLGPRPRVSVSVGLGWGPRICISAKFSDNSDAAGLGIPLGEPLL